ncbi:MAG: ABC transporter ATP-binding protein, partial [Ornithinibacter sp.]
MSELKTEEEKAAEQRRGPAAARRGGPPHLQIGVPTEKSQDFVPSAKRLLRLLHPERFIVYTVIAFAVGSVVLSAIGPKILGGATDLIFAGVFGAQIPAGVTQQQAADALRAQGQDNLADMLGAMQHVVPGQGINFTALARILLFVLGLYIVAALLQWVQGRMLTIAVNRTIYRLRRDVEDKLNRLALPYFDQQPRGELLSRVTNDIDNLSQSLQQTMSQLLTSVLTVLAVLGMMIWISPLLALVALISVPLSMLLTGGVMKRSQGMFVQQWRRTGRLNAHIEETFSGHALVKVFGRQREAERVFAEENDELFRSSFTAQFVSGLIMPIMMFIGNINYVLVAVIGGLRVASGALSLGEVQAFIQYSRQFTQPLSQVASMTNLLQSGVASAE